MRISTCIERRGRWWLLVACALTAPVGLADPPALRKEVRKLLAQSQRLVQGSSFAEAARVLEAAPSGCSLPEQAALLWQRSLVQLRWARQLRHGGDAAEALRRAEHAIASAQQAFELAGGGSRQLEGIAYLELGLDWQSLRAPEKALPELVKATGLLTDGSGWEEIAWLSLGWLHYGQARYVASLEAFQRALDLTRRGDRALEVETLIGLGRSQEGLSRYAEAIATQTQALAAASALGSPTRKMNALNALAISYSWISQNARAASLYEEALAIARSAKDAASEAVFLGNLGEERQALGEHERARADFTLALSASRRLGDRGAEALNLARLAATLRETGDLKQARARLAQALPVAYQARDAYGLGITLFELGELHLALHEPAEAIPNYEQVAFMAAQAGMPHGEGAALAGLMRAWRARGSLRLASYYGKRAVNAYQQVRGNLGSLDREARHQYAHSLEETYRALADILLEQDRLPEAQQVLDLVKEEEFAAFAKRSEGAPLGPARVGFTPVELRIDEQARPARNRAAEIARQLGELKTKTTLRPEDKVLRAQLEAELSQSLQAFQRFLDAVASDPVMIQRTTEIKKLREAEGLAADLRELGQGVVAVYTLVTADRVRLILIAPDFYRGYDVPVPAAGLRQKVMEFRDLVGRPPVPATSARHLLLAQELYQIVVEPLAHDLDRLHARTVMWSLDGVLRYLPLAALHDGQVYLVEKYASAVFTPASEARLKDQPRSQWTALALGVSRAHGNMAALPAVPDELNSVVRRDANGNTGVLPGRIRLDAEFTLESMQTDLYDHYQVVHIASHFSFRPGNEDDSFLLLGDGRHLSLGEVRALPAVFEGVDLLTLSACDTGMGDAFGDGKEIEGFAVTAQRKGAKGVIATLWSVADASTQILMRELYRAHESSGVSKAESLRRAQLALLRGGVGVDGAAPTYAYPYYWAAFLLLGNSL